MSELTPQATSLQSLYAWFSENKLYVNRRYQRKLVWTLHEKQKLIESILKKYPIPAILIAEREQEAGTYEIIDGLQRLHAIVSFIENSYSTLDGKLFDLRYFPTAKARADEGVFAPTASTNLLSQREVSTILDYTLSLSVMRNASDAEVNDVFGRINTYGHRLSDQERRQAGVENSFSSMVRDIACTVRGDVSAEVLLLDQMPSISIDLPMTKHGYEVQADEVVWVTEGILRSTDLRDSMDEQCIADIAACVIGGELIERSKDALDEIYSDGSAESERIINALEIYGDKRFAEEFKYSFDEIIKMCSAGRRDKLRDILFAKNTTNAFPSVFAVLLIAFHELIVVGKSKISDYDGLKKALTKLDERLTTGRKATSPEERRKNVDTIKGLVSGFFVKADVGKEIYGSHATTDIDALIRRSEIELANYELKQGMLTLHPTKRAVDVNLIEKVINTICAIANNGPHVIGKLVIGVTDKVEDVAQVQKLDGVTAKRVGKRSVVGVLREAKAMGITMEDYFSKWKDAIKNSQLSPGLRDAVLSNMDFNSYYNYGVLVFTIPAQKELSYVGDKIYWRDGDATKQAEQARQIADLAKRF